MSFIYNRYAEPDVPLYSSRAFRDTSPLPESKQRPPSSADDSRREHGFFHSPAGLFSELLPKNLDWGDFLLLAVFLLLYIDSKDEEFLIILVILGITVLRP